MLTVAFGRDSEFKDDREGIGDPDRLSAAGTGGPGRRGADDPAGFRIQADVSGRLHDLDVHQFPGLVNREPEPDGPLRTIIPGAVVNRSRTVPCVPSFREP